MNCELNNATRDTKRLQFRWFYDSPALQAHPGVSKHLDVLLKHDQDPQTSIKMNISSIIQFSPYIVFHANDGGVSPQIQSTLACVLTQGFKG